MVQSQYTEMIQYVGTLAHAFWARVSFPEVQSFVEAGRTDVKTAWPPFSAPCASLIKFSTHPENFRIISYNLHFYFEVKIVATYAIATTTFSMRGLLRWTQLQ